MKNLIEEKPSMKLTGRLKKTYQFVDLENMKDKSILDIGCGYRWYAFNKQAKKIAGAETPENDLPTIKKYIKNPNFFPVVGYALNIHEKDSSFGMMLYGTWLSTFLNILKEHFSEKPLPIKEGWLIFL